MPEPYKFPEHPKNSHGFTDPRMQPIQLSEVSGTSLILTPPCEESNYIGYFFHGNHEVLRYALVANDDLTCVITITEDGKEITMNKLISLAFRILLGTERFNKVKDQMEWET